MKNILFDLTSTQPIRGSKFHGGGDYAEVVFNKIIYSYNKDDINLYAAYDSSRYINIDLIGSYIYSSPKYSSSVTGLHHSLLHSSPGHSTAMWLNQLSFFAPCQCSTFAGITITVPG